MKKLIGIIALMLAMVLLLTACGGKEKSSSSGDDILLNPGQATEAPKTEGTAGTGETAKTEETGKTEETAGTGETTQSDTSSSLFPGLVSAPASTSASGIEGTWKLTGMKADALSAEQVQMMEMMISSGMISIEMTFKDGKATITETMADFTGEGGGSQTQTMNGTYTYENGKLTVVEEGQTATADSTADCKLDGDTLEMGTPEGTMVFTRQK